MFRENKGDEMKEDKEIIAIIIVGMILAMFLVVVATQLSKNREYDCFEITQDQACFSRKY